MFPSVTATLFAAILLLEAAAYAVYVGAILRRRVIPSRASWLIWTPLLWLTVVSSWQAGAGAPLIKTAATAVGVTLIGVLALRYGTGGWSRTDRTCFALTAAGVAGWALSADPVLALCLFILADAAGAIPTVRDVAREPTRERPAYWVLCGISSVLALALVGPEFWTADPDGFAQWSYPAYQIVVNAAVLLAMFSASAIQQRRPRPTVTV